MADKSTGIRFDDFIAKVHADPANVEPKTLLSGYIGRGEEDGKVRIYSDQSLSHWVEAAADDVVHSQPIEGSALGGSHVWLKGDAQLKPGSAAGASPAAQAVPAGGIGADTGVFNPYTTIHPTLITQLPPCGHLTAATVCQISPCPTVVQPCGPHITAANVCTAATVCQISPCPTLIYPCGHPRTVETVCTLAPPCHTHEFICARPTQICPPTSSNCPTHNIICVASGGFACPPPFTINEHPQVNPQIHAQALMAAAPGTIGCGNTQHGCPPTYNPGCPSTSTCPPTHNPGCPSSSTCPPTHNVLGCGNTQHGCPPTHMYGCGSHTLVPNCAPTQLLGCGNTQHGCPPTHMYGCGPHTFVPNCAPTHLAGCPGTSTCTPQGGTGQAVTLGIGCMPTLPQHCFPATVPGAGC